jgi:dihydrofolate reductase
MKAQDGKDLIIYGNGPLGAELPEHGLLDDLQFAIHSVFVGESTPLLRQGATAALEPTGARTLRTGVIAIRYRPADG